MRLNLNLLVILAVLLTMAEARGENPLLPGIKGNDDRVAVQSSVYPWSTVGRLNRTIGGFCTGVLVGERLVLTAAHCLWNHRTQRFLPPGSLHFLAGYQRGDYLRHSKGVKIQVPGSYRPAARTRRANPAHDWALVTLADNVGGQIGYLKLTALSPEKLAGLKREGAILAQAGYSQDKAHILTVHKGCQILAFLQGETLISHNCDAVPGDSGSPILLIQENVITIVAIHVATTKGGVTAMGIGVSAKVFMDEITRTLLSDASP